MRLATPKGFRDFLPQDALKRKFVLEKITQIFEKFGFDPLETPTLEYAETLEGKYGEEEKLIYKFETPGGDKVALKYDQTVPLARVVGQYGPTGQQTLPMPFKRYQIQPAYRGENPQKGRYREFLQCDADIVGVSSPLADAELLALVYEVYKSLGLDVLIKINDRALLQGIKPTYLAAIDKLSKIGEGNVLTELEQKGLSKKEAVETLGKVQTSQLTPNLKQIIESFEQMGYPKGAIAFDPILVRGLDYYTGLILEVVLKSDPTSSSLCGGGRYDELIGRISGNDLPATGFAIGVDRTIEAMEKEVWVGEVKTLTKVLVTIFSPGLAEKSIEAASKLRSAGIACDLWLNPDTKLEKQLKYADSKKILYAIIIGPDEVSTETVVLKNLVTGAQESVTSSELVGTLEDYCLH